MKRYDLVMAAVPSALLGLRHHLGPPPRRRSFAPRGCHQIGKRPGAVGDVAVLLPDPPVVVGLDDLKETHAKLFDSVEGVPHRNCSLNVRMNRSETPFHWGSATYDGLL